MQFWQFQWANIHQNYVWRSCFHGYQIKSNLVHLFVYYAFFRTIKHSELKHGPNSCLNSVIKWWYISSKLVSLSCRIQRITYSLDTESFNKNRFCSSLVSSYLLKVTKKLHGFRSSDFVVDFEKYLPTG